MLFSHNLTARTRDPWLSRLPRDFAAVAAAALIAVSLVHGQQFAPAVQTPDYAPGEVLVKFKDGPASGDVESAMIGASLASVVGGVDVSRIRLPAGMSVPAALAYFSALPSVEFAEPNGVLYLAETPDDPYFSTQWALTQIQAPAAWDITLGSESVRVAVLDSGYDTTHPDLASKVMFAEDLTSIDGTYDVHDYRGHGTLCAGAVAAATDNAVGVASIGWNTTLMIGKVTGDNGILYLSELADGIDWATANGAQVISMSLSHWKSYTTLRNAVDNAWDAGVLLVAAAGNNNDTKNQYPAAYTDCIAVAATDQNDARASFSTYGSWIDVAAPGVSILTTATGGSYAYASGTSLSCPQVAGLAALIWATPHGTSNAAVRARLESTGVPVTNGFGRYPTKRINALAAVE